jgi:hypothetical protein
MDISFNTIELLTSQSAYKKLESSKNNVEATNNDSKQLRRDIIFYKKRIYAKTRELIKFYIQKPELQNETFQTIETKLKESFLLYVKTLVDNFKFDDTMELMQKELESGKKVTFQDATPSLASLQEDYNPDSFIMNLNKEIQQPKINELMNVKIKNKKENKIIMPEKKSFKINTKEFRQKGVKSSKNKNLNNLYTNENAKRETTKKENKK